MTGPDVLLAIVLAGLAAFVLYQMARRREQAKRDPRYEPSYHDLFITAPDIERTSIFNLGYNLEVSCTRTGGWRLWAKPFDKMSTLLGGEYDGPDRWLILDVAGHVIVNSRDRADEDDG